MTNREFVEQFASRISFQEPDIVGAADLLLELCKRRDSVRLRIAPGTAVIVQIDGSEVFPFEAAGMRDYFRTLLARISVVVGSNAYGGRQTISNISAEEHPIVVEFRNTTSCQWFSSVRITSRREP
jgi:hypothetical protein